MRWATAMAAGLALLTVTRPQGQALPGFGGVLDEHRAIQYSSRATTDRVAALDRALADGTRSLVHDPQTGYLRPVLDALGISVTSQLLVFSKTGIQRTHTGPRTPRALYFDQSAVVGYIPGAPLLEVAVQDPQQGVVFYTLDQSAPGAPRFTRGTGCLTCHVAASTLEVPGMIARSHVVATDGTVLPREPVVAVNHATPHTARWGGWFVTSNGAAPPYSQGAHAGNVAAAWHPASGPAIVSNHVFVEWMDSAPESRGYPADASDLAALLAFDHQMHAINLITRINWEARAAASERRDVLRAVSGPVRELADYLLFANEAPLAAEIAPRADFAAQLAARTPADAHGRSFGQLDGTTRLLRYPCSYMVYAPAFEALPPAVKAAVYLRMATILSGRVAGPQYAHLRPAVRQAIVEILRATRPDFSTATRG